jgi:hypothetical protein
MNNLLPSQLDAMERMRRRFIHFLSLQADIQTVDLQRMQTGMFINSAMLAPPPHPASPYLFS